MNCCLNPDLTKKWNSSTGSSGGRGRDWHVWETQCDWRGASRGRRERGMGSGRNLLTQAHDPRSLDFILTPKGQH